MYFIELDGGVMGRIVVRSAGLFQLGITFQLYGFLPAS